MKSYSDSYKAAGVDITAGYRAVELMKKHIAETMTKGSMSDIGGFGGLFELDIVLRNNITTEEHPLGVYHPHADVHHIKKENIGLIEVMGLAVLPARLRDELATMCQYIAEGKDFADNADIEKHKEWFESIKDKYTFTPENTEDILKQEIGKVFQRVLEDAGVYKRTDEGKAAFIRFTDSVNAN